MKNPKERSTAILVGVAAGAILMALMFFYDCIFGFSYWNSRCGTGTADCCSICNIRMVNRMESAYPEE